MTRKARRPAAPKPPKLPKPPSSEAGGAPELEELELEDLEPGEGEGPPFEALQRLGVDRSAAIFLVAYVRARLTEPETESNVLAIAQQCRAHPWVWTALQRTDYVGFLHALEICGLPPVSVKEMQTNVTDIDAELRAAVSPRASDTEPAPELEEEPREDLAPAP